MHDIFRAYLRDRAVSAAVNRLSHRYETLVVNLRTGLGECPLLIPFALADLSFNMAEEHKGDDLLHPRRASSIPKKKFSIVEFTIEQRKLAEKVLGKWHVLIEDAHSKLKARMSSLNLWL